MRNSATADVMRSATCGPVAAMFNTITCAVTVGYVEKFIGAKPHSEVHFQFRSVCNHNGGGSNGYTVRKIIDVK